MTGRCFAIVLAIAIVAGPEDTRSADPLQRRVPPPGIALDPRDRSRLEDRLRATAKRLVEFRDHRLAADIEIYLKAVDYALQHDEFYKETDLAVAQQALKTANARLEQLAQGDPLWQDQRGLVVRGYHSSIDGSPQPYGLVIPDQLDLQQPVPLYVWLHGRGDKITDLHFIERRQKDLGRIAPQNAIVLHPFGRQCLGYKSAGEVDVLEAIEDVKTRYHIDPRRIVLMGFSMGGAGVWHLGAHYTDRFAALSAGAGFAETAQYNQLAAADFPPWYEQTLWGIYDVPHYVRNLFNLPVVAYSGQLDRQIQAARIMEAAFREHGRQLPHLIGPGMGHKYHPESLAEIMRRMDRAVKEASPQSPRQIFLQTRTLRYNRMHWVQLLGLEHHWTDSRVDARIVGPRRVQMTTQNITALRLDPWQPMDRAVIEIDGDVIHITPQKAKKTAPPPAFLRLVRQAGHWQESHPAVRLSHALAKRPGLQGPIDDVLMEPFLVVTPSGRSSNEQVNQWIDFELDHFRRRWQALYRGRLREKQDVHVTDADIRQYHLIAWGDAASNQLVRRLLADLPVHWSESEIRLGKKTYAAQQHVPLLIYPNPLNRQKYVVLNSGPTHREGHDRTNSLQNPKLPDWAVLEISEPPSELAAGRVVAADFFDEAWQLKKQGESPVAPPN